MQPKAHNWPDSRGATEHALMWECVNSYVRHPSLYAQLRPYPDLS